MNWRELLVILVILTVLFFCFLLVRSALKEES